MNLDSQLSIDFQRNNPLQLYFSKYGDKLTRSNKFKLKKFYLSQHKMQDLFRKIVNFENFPRKNLQYEDLFNMLL